MLKISDRVLASLPMDLTQSFESAAKLSKGSPVSGSISVCNKTESNYIKKLFSDLLFTDKKRKSDSP